MRPSDSATLFDHLSDRLNEGHSAQYDEQIADERALGDSDSRTRAAVLMAVTERAEPGLILTHRPQSMRSHPGQVAFPGGKIDPGDENAIAAALREAHEELAIEPHHVSIIGETDDYHTGSGFHITPVLAVIPPDLPLEPNPHEVDSWFEVPLSFVLDPKNAQRHSGHWQGQERFYYDMDYQGHRIWGVTAGIIVNLAKRLRWTV